jgi:hypothetical protein
MTDKPRVLTVAEVDAIASLEDCYATSCCLNDPCYCDHMRRGDLASLLRMARAMAWAQENAGEIEPVADNRWQVKWGVWDRWVRWFRGETIVEAIEEAIEAAAIAAGKETR